MLFKISLTLSYSYQVHMKTGHVKHIRTLLYGNISADFFISLSLSQIIAAYVFSSSECVCLQSLPIFSRENLVRTNENMCYY